MNKIILLSFVIFLGLGAMVARAYSTYSPYNLSYYDGVYGYSTPFSAIYRNTGTVCTMDAYVCPNGTTVGRTGANCQFVCPSTTNITSSSYTYTDGCYTYSFNQNTRATTILSNNCQSNYGYYQQPSYSYTSPVVSTSYIQPTQSYYTQPSSWYYSQNVSSINSYLLNYTTPYNGYSNYYNTSYYPSYGYGNYYGYSAYDTFGYNYSYCYYNTYGFQVCQ